MSRRKRRKKFVDSRVQGALARRIMFHWIAFAFTAFSTAFILQVLSNPFLPLWIHAKNLWWNNGPFLLILVFLLPVFMFDTIKLSHRFAGPICRLRGAMRAVSSGQPPKKLSFRGDDFWHDLADEYNAMMEKLVPNALSRDDGEQDDQAKETELVGTQG